MSSDRHISSYGRQPADDPFPDWPDDAGRFRLRTLGDNRLHHMPPGGDPTEVLGPGKPLSVVIYLACIPGHSATRDRLIDLLWTNLDLDGARHALRQALWYLRKQMGDEAILSEGREVRLAAPVGSDRNAFLEAVSREDYGEAADLYEGPFVPMFAAPGGAEFEKWVDLERRQLRTLFFRAAECMTREHLASGEPERAKTLAARARDQAPIKEAGWRLVLETFLAAGDEVGAELEAQALENRLDELGREPEPATRRLLDVVRKERGPPVKTADHGLEPELVGREREFSTLLSAWRRAHAGEVEHLHVVGKAGVGKTRLLAAACRRIEALGAVCVDVDASQGERAVAYALASHLVAELAGLPGASEIPDGVKGTLVALNPKLTDRYSAPPDDAEGAEAHRRRQIALNELLVSVAGEAPLAVLVDDLHWADPESRRLLNGALGRIHDGRILIVTTGRPEVRESTELEATETLSLEPLSPSETEVLVASVGSLPEEPWTEEFLDRLHAATGGVPFLILETLRLAIERAWLVLEDGEWRCPDPGTMAAELGTGGPLLRRVKDLSSTRSELLLLLCAAGRVPLGAALLGSALERPGESVLGDLRSLELRGLVSRHGKRWRPAHDQIAAGVLERVDHERLRRAHGALGSAYRRSDEAPEKLQRAGRHLSAAGEEDALRDVFARWVATLRRRGDRRSTEALAREFVRGGEDPRRIRNLASSLPLRVRIGLTSPGRVAAAAAGLIAVGIVTIAGALGALPLSPASTDPDAELLATVRGERGGAEGYRVPVRREGWEERTEMGLVGDGDRIPTLDGVRAARPIVPSPGGRRWAYTRAVADSGGLDVFLASSGEAGRRMTSARMDDVVHDWSPDGGSLLLVTCRWSSRCWRDVAVLEVESGEIRRLTRTEVPEAEPNWSPDGTRIAFQRRHHVVGSTDGRGEIVEAGEAPSRRSEICWMTVDGERESCFEPEVPLSLVGWSDADGLLAIASGREGRSLVEVDLEGVRIRTIDERAKRARVSPDGRWTAAFRSGEGASSGWYLYPTDRSDLAVRLLEDGEQRDMRLSWIPRASGRRYLDSIRMVAPDSATIGVPGWLRVEGFDAEGRPHSPSVVSWVSGDSAVASVDRDSGILRPRGTGEVRVFASAGGWREDSATVSIVRPGFETVLDELWTAGIEERWVPYGSPRPSTAPWPGGGRAFWNRGDGSFSSGAYARRDLRGANRGMGLEARISTPITRIREQGVWLGFRTWSEPGRIEGWDHRTGDLSVGIHTCYFRYPAGDGRENRRRAVVSGSDGIRMDSVHSSGRPYVVRLQIFPDGTCGVALNGTAITRSVMPVPEDATYRITLQGNSVDTRILVGRLEAWKGIKPGVDWSDVDLHVSTGSGP